MPLTPEDVSNKRFTPVRLREGYDMGEVDQFLDEVEAELARLTSENDDLRAKLSGDETAGTSTSVSTPVTPAKKDAASTEEAAAVTTPAASNVETPRVATVPHASNAAARLLELATRNADELVDEAKLEADKIVGEARTTSERLANEAKQKADKLEGDARGRSEMLDSETAERRTQLFGDLEKERNTLNGEVENLRSFEREYRSRLKSYFTEQLKALDGAGDSPASQGEQAQPKRLRSILGDDES